MARGTVKKLVNERGFGFISTEEGGGDVFFHHSVVEDGGFDTLREGQSVEYELEAGGSRGKGPRASKVRAV